MPLAGFAAIWTATVGPPLLYSEIMEEPAIFFPMGFPSMTAIEMPLG